MESAPTIRHAVPGDLDTLVDTLSDSFSADPMFNWVFPKQDLYPYFFRMLVKDVYLPRGIARIKKSSTHDRVRLVAAEPAALLRSLPPIPRGSMCAAQYLSRSLMKSRTQGTASHAPTTLVLETRPRGFLDRRHQFCSDLQNKISEPRGSVSSVMSDGG